MKKITSVLVILILIIQAIGCSAFAENAVSVSNGVKIYTLETFDDFNPSYSGGVGVEYPLNDRVYSFELLKSDIGYIQEAFSFSNLEYNAQKTLSEINAGNYGISGSAKIDFVEDDTNFRWIIYFCDEEVRIIRIYLSFSENESHHMSMGIFKFKNPESFKTISDLMLGYTKSAEYKENAEKRGKPVYEFKELCGYKIPYNNGYVTWGFCSYKEDGDQIERIYSYLDLFGEGRDLILISDKTSDHTINFDGKTLYCPNDSDAYILENESINWAYTWSVVPTLDNDRKISSLKLYETHLKSSQKRELIYSDEQLSDVPLVDYEGFEFLTESEESKDSVKEESKNTTEKEPQENNNSELKEDPLTYIASDSYSVDSVTYTYMSGGTVKEIIKRKNQLNTGDMAKKIHSLIKSGTFEPIEKRPDKPGRMVANILYENGDGKESFYMCVYENCIEIFGRKNLSFEQYYAPSGINLVDGFDKLFKDWVTEEETDFIKYQDITLLKPRYIAEFEIIPDKSQMETWIGEVCENGKVKAVICYDNSERSWITLSGNGKSYTIVQKYYNWTGDNVYVTDNIGIDNNTPIPHCFEKGGAISLSWDRWVDYNRSDDLKVTLYQKTDSTKSASPENINMNSPVGSEIKIEKISEMKDLTIPDETPIRETERPNQVFTDVTPDHWAFDNVGRFYYAGIVRGIGSGLCAPDDYITYEHFSLLLKRLFFYQAQNTSSVPALRQYVIAELVKACGLGEGDLENEHILDDFSDNSLLNSQTRSYVQRAVEEGLVEGYGGKLHVNDKLTRAEAITLLYRAIKIVYGITDEDLPEHYKLIINSDNGEYLTLTASELSGLKIKNPQSDGEEYLVYVTNEERLDGKMIVSSGKNAVDDTYIYAVCECDNDVYTVESRSIYFVNKNSHGYVYRVYMDIYKNGQPVYINQYMTADCVISDSEAWLKWGVSIEMYFKKLLSDNGKNPSIPEIQPRDKDLQEQEKWDGGKTYFSHGYLKNLKGPAIIDDMYNLPEGNMTVTFTPKGDEVKVEGEFTAPTISSQISQFMFELTEVINIDKSAVSGKFNIYSDGIPVAEGISGMISGLDADLGEYLTFSTDDGLWNLSLKISEIGQ